MELPDNTELFTRLSPGAAIVLSILSTIFTGLVLKFGEYFLERFKDSKKAKEEENERNIKAKLDDHVFLSAERDKVREELIEDNERIRNIIKEKDEEIDKKAKELRELQNSYRELVEKYLKLTLEIDQMRSSHNSLKGKVKVLKDQGIEINHDTNFDIEDESEI